MSDYTELLGNPDFGSRVKQQSYKEAVVHVLLIYFLLWILAHFKYEIFQLVHNILGVQNFEYNFKYGIQELLWLKWISGSLNKMPGCLIDKRTLPSHISINHFKIQKLGFQTSSTTEVLLADLQRICVIHNLLKKKEKFWNNSQSVYQPFYIFIQAF